MDDSIIDDSDTDTAIRVGRFEIEPSEGMVRLKRDVFRLEPKVMRLFLVLVRHAGRTLSRQQIIDDVWDGDPVDEHAIEECVARLRQILAKDDHDSVTVKTVPRVGYRLEESGSGGFDVGEWDAIHATPEKKPIRLPVSTLSRLVAVVAAVAGVAVIPLIAMAWKSSAPPAAADGAKVLEGPLTTLKGQELDPAYSPDGKRLAVSWGGEKGDNWDIYIKSIGSSTMTRVTRHPGRDHSPRWSPDGSKVFFARIKDGACAILSASAEGGKEMPVTGCRNPSFVTMDVSADGRLAAFREREKDDGPFRLRLLVLADGRSTYVPGPDEKWLGDEELAFSPDGRTIAFVRAESKGAEDLYLYTLATAQVQRITQDNARIRGLAWGPQSRKIYFSSNRDGRSRLWLVDLDAGTLARLPAKGEEIGALALTRNGSHLAYENKQTRTAIARLDRARGQDVKFTEALAPATVNWGVDLSPDGQTLAFLSNRTGAPELWVSTFDGQNQRKLTSYNGPELAAPRWSPDGQSITFGVAMNGVWDVALIPAAGGTPVALIPNGASETAPRWSKDGQQVYFGSDRDGEWRVWRMDPRGGTPEAISAPGGFVGQEGPNGKWLYYVKRTEPGLWRKWIGGPQPEEKVLDDLDPADWNAWLIRGNGVYYVKREEKGNPTLRHFGLDGSRKGKERQIAELQRLFDDSGLAMTQDGRAFFFTQLAQLETDVFQRRMR